MYFLTVSGNTLVANNSPILLRGAGLGNWLNLEHFLLGLPGTETQIRQAITEAYGHERAQTFWQKYYTVYVSEADIAYAKECGFNHLRLPVNYALFFDDKFENSTAIRELNRVLGYCKKYGIWGIIDLHAVPGGQNPDWHSDNASGRDNFWQDAQAQENVIALWAKIANYYKDEPTVGAYDLINEPCFFNPESEQALIHFFKRCTQAIRAVDSQHVLFYTGNTYGRDFSMFTENLDDNSAFTFHLYPFLQIANDLTAENRREKINDSLYRDVTFKRLETLNKPLWCGETGHPLNQPDTTGALHEFIAILEQKNVGWSLWPMKDRGAMAVTHASLDGRWNRLCDKATNRWSFWDLFSEDSLISAEKETDKYKHYDWLATETTKGWQVFRKNLAEIPFDDLMQSLDDFKFENCVKNSALQKF